MSSRVDALVHRDAEGDGLSSESYSYNAVNDMVSKVVDGVTTTYDYDAVSQLIEEDRTGYNATYTYDANGNRTSRTVNSMTESYAYDAADKLTAITGGSNPASNRSRIGVPVQMLSGLSNFIDSWVQVEVGEMITWAHSKPDSYDVRPVVIGLYGYGMADKLTIRTTYEECERFAAKGFAYLEAFVKAGVEEAGGAD